MTTKKKIKSPSGNSRAAKNRKIRKDALREELASRNTISQLTKIAGRLDPEAKNAYKREDVPMIKERVSILFKMLDKTLPNLKPVDQAITFPLKKALADQASSILRAIATGKITPSDGATLMSTVSSQARVLEVDELEKRISKLENSHGQH